MDLTRTALTRAFAHLHASSGPEDTPHTRIDLVLSSSFVVIATSFACAVVFVIAPPTTNGDQTFLAVLPLVAFVSTLLFFCVERGVRGEHKSHWVEWKIVADMSKRHWLADEKGEVTADWKRKDLDDRVSRLLASAPPLSACDYECGTRDAQCDPAWFSLRKGGV